VIDLAPDWVEAHINLGTALFQLKQMEEAKQEYLQASRLEPNHALVQFNLGCVLEQLGETEASIERLQRAIQLAPHLADAHLNLALAYEKRGETEAARLHLSRYLHYEPQGPWADYARQYVRPRQFQPEAPPAKRGGRMGKITPFRRR
jgi:tetratricopeptide (TPR) repeat protein